MRKLALLALPGLLLAGAAQSAHPKQTLAQALEGRVAEEAVNCINLRTIRGSRVVDGAILYDAGNVIYVNHPRAGADALNSWDSLLSRTNSQQLCSVDVVETYDVSTRMATGTVFLGEFVPYRRAAR